MKQTTVVESYELLSFAKENLGIDCNECHDIFYQGHETLYSPESSNKRIDLDDICEQLNWFEQNRITKDHKLNKEKTCEILKSFMIANNLTEMLILSSK